jgi:O-antigen ligase
LELRLGKGKSQPMSTQPARRQQRAVAALFLMAPAAGVAGGLALAPLLALFGAIGAPWTRPRTPPWLSLIVLAAATWAALSIFWSPGPRPEQALKILATAAAGSAFVAGAAGLGSPARPMARAAMVAGVLMLALLLGIEAWFNMPITRAAQPTAPTGLIERNPGRGVLLLELFGFAALAALRNYPRGLRWGLGLALLAAMAVLSLQFGMDANAVAAVLGLAAFAIGYAAPRLAPRLIAFVLAGWMLAAPWALLALAEVTEALAVRLPASWGMRVHIWNYAAARIAEKPVFGWGLDSSRTFGAEQSLGDLRFPAIPLHPHNLSLQIWLETGAVGALVFAAAIAASGVAAARAIGAQRAPAAAAVASFAIIGFAWNVSYGAWQEWFMATPFIAAAAMLLTRCETSR